MVKSSSSPKREGVVAEGCSPPLDRDASPSPSGIGLKGLMNVMIPNTSTEVSVACVVCMGVRSSEAISGTMKVDSLPAESSESGREESDKDEIDCEWSTMVRASPFGVEDSPMRYCEL